jgi:hypothetical protein
MINGMSNFNKIRDKNAQFQNLNESDMNMEPLKAFNSKINEENSLDDNESHLTFSH